MVNDPLTSFFASPCLRFYTDRGGHYFVTPKDASTVDKTQFTQVGRALSQLGITHCQLGADSRPG
jgi:hypothetical protein